ncbi:MAG: hypothetical protein OXC37_00920 [Bdellovibrionaceae bacterium]|nr:hypothetical protein [Pseudobdellovibrionaceae bacterium]
MINSKRSNGQYFTKGNPFDLKPFKKWLRQTNLHHEILLEPFAGANDIIKTLQSMNLCNKVSSYDISPLDESIKKQDTIKNFPKGYKVCITNPPWLARNSATRRGLPYPKTTFDDLYKHCLSLCLDHCEYIGALIPASFLQAKSFRERLSKYILLHKNLFMDTENPTCLALFNSKKSSRTDIYYDNDHLGTLSQLEKALPKARNDKKIRFNDPNGKLGFISFDNTKKRTIRFCEVEEIKHYPVKVSSRFFTRINGEFDNIPKMIKKLNLQINQFREDTRDIFLTPFKGMHKDGYYRRRMEFSMARDFINAL